VVYHIENKVLPGKDAALSEDKQSAAGTFAHAPSREKGRVSWCVLGLPWRIRTSVAHHYWYDPAHAGDDADGWLPNVVLDKDVSVERIYHQQIYVQDGSEDSNDTELAVPDRTRSEIRGEQEEFVGHP
jgi:hypothetical protein